jgi:hypothetical protein
MISKKTEIQIPKKNGIDFHWFSTSFVKDVDVKKNYVQLSQKLGNGRNQKIHICKKDWELIKETIDEVFNNYKKITKHLEKIK